MSNKIDATQTYTELERNKKIVPEFTIEPRGMHNAIKTIDHPFLQSIANTEAVIVLDRDGFSVYGYVSIAHFFIHADRVTMEVITTYPDDRMEGSGTAMMEFLCYHADLTNTIIELRTAVVVAHPVHTIIPIMLGANKLNKIPLEKLEKWYEKFGFVTYDNRAKSAYMRRIPGITA